MLTEDDIEAGRTATGGFSRAQLAVWGVPWPPPKGWKQALLGKENASSSTVKARKVKPDPTARKQPRPFIPADPQSHREDGSPGAGDGQVYVTRTGKLFHTQWCSIMAAYWRDNHRGIHVSNMADVGQRGSCAQCESDPELAVRRRLNKTMDRLGRIIARILVEKGPEGVNQVRPYVIQFRDAEAELTKLSGSVAAEVPDSYDA